MYRDLIDSLIPIIRAKLEEHDLDAKAILAELNTPCFKEFIVMYIRFRRDGDKTLPVDTIVNYLLGGCTGSLHSRIREIREVLFATDTAQGILGKHKATQEEISRMTDLIAELTAYIKLYYKYYREAPVSEIEAEIDSIYDNDSLMAKYDTFRKFVDGFTYRGIPNAGLNAELTRLKRQSMPLPKINANHQRRLTEEKERRKMTGRKVGIRTNTMRPMTYVTPSNAALPAPPNAVVPALPNAAFTPKLNTLYTDGKTYYEFITLEKKAPIVKQYTIADESVTATEYAGPIPKLMPVTKIPPALLSHLEKDLDEKITDAIKSEQTKIPLTYTLISIDPNGDCLFNAIADQFFGSPNQGAYLRQLAMAAIQVDTFLDDHPSFLIPAPSLANRNPRAIPKEEYITEYSKQGTYGGEVELKQLANMLSCAIVVHYVDRDEFQSFPQIGDGPLIHLMHYGEERFPHYDSLRVNADTYPIFRGSKPSIPPLNDPELATKLSAIKAALSKRGSVSENTVSSPVAVPPPNAPLHPPTLTPPPNKPKSLKTLKADAQVLRAELGLWFSKNPGQSQRFADLLREATLMRANQQPQINALRTQLEGAANNSTRLALQTQLDNILSISKGLTNAAETHPMSKQMQQLKTLDSQIADLEGRARVARGGYRKRTNKKNKSIRRRTRRSKLRI
jgi:hypothetical protein